MGGAVIMFGLLEFLPGWGLAKIQQRFDVLRIPRAFELEGLDFEGIELWRPLNLM
jgi:hypothetical protein